MKVLRPVQSDLFLGGVFTFLFLISLFATDANWGLYCIALTLMTAYFVISSLCAKRLIKDHYLESMALGVMVVGFFIISVAWSPIVSISLFELQTFYILSVCAVGLMLQGKHFSRIMLAAAVPIYGGLTIWGIKQHLLDGELARGLFNDPNLYAGLILSMAAVASGAAYDAWVKSRTRVAGALVTIVALSLVAAFFAHSRSASLALLVAAGACLLALGHHLKFRLVHQAGLLAGGVLLLALATYAKGGTAFLSEVTLDKSIASRIAMTKSTLSMISDNPIKGVGFGLWHISYPQYRLAQDVDSAGYRAHNDYLEMLATGGPIGLVFLLIVPVIGLRAVHKARNRKLSAPGLFIGLAIALFLLCIQALINFVFHQTGVSVWMGLLIGALYCEITGGEIKEGKLSQLAGISAVSLVLTTAILTTVGYLSMLPTTIMSNKLGFEARYFEGILSTVNLKKLAVANPYSTDALFVLGQQAHSRALRAKTFPQRQKELRLAFDYYSRAQTIEPGQPVIYLRQALVVSEYANLSQEDRYKKQSYYFEQALTRDPGMYLAIEQYTKLLVERKDYEKVRAILKKGLQVTAPVRQKPLGLLKKALEAQMAAKPS